MVFMTQGSNRHKILSLFCKSSNKSAAKYKFLFLNDQAILTYCLLTNSIFSLYDRDSANFKFLNC